MCRYQWTSVPYPELKTTTNISINLHLVKSEQFKVQNKKSHQVFPEFGKEFGQYLVMMKLKTVEFGKTWDEESFRNHRER